jgi:proteasome-associated ATPase
MLSEIDLGLTSKPQAPVEWDDVGGLEQAKRELRDAIDSPTRYPELYRHYNKKPPRGILLYGPPGTGKTYLVKAAATAHARANNLPLGISGMLYVKASELVTKYVGVSEENLREVFRTAREFYETYKCPLLVFFDEAEATFKKRGSGISSDVQDTMVPTLLTEMDGFDENHVLAIFATNRVDILDPALLRDGRIDVKLYIGRPDIKVAETILGIHLKRVPVLEEFENSAAFAAAEFFNPKYAYNLIVVSSKVDPAQVEEIPFTLGNLASGASLAGIVERARNNAFHRDVNNKTMTGVGQEDILAAIRTTFESNERLNLAAEIELFVEQIDDIKQRFRGLKPLRQVTA